VRTVVLRVAALALLLLLALVAALTMRTLGQLPDVTIYLVRDDGASFVLEPVYRRLRADARDAAGATHPNERTVRVAIAALATGPSEEEAARGLGSEVPAGTRVLGVRLDDGVVTVDLSNDFTHGGGTASMLGRLHQVLHTAVRPSGVEAVRVLVEGRPLEVLGGEGIMVEQQWRAPEAGLPRW
jgi:spore germination protein GerM